MKKKMLNQSVKRLLFCYGLLFHFTAQAESIAKAVLPPDESPLLSVAVGDWNGDKQIDSAVLIKSGDQADLYIYFHATDRTMGLKLYKKNVAWAGTMAGTKPSLKTLEKGGLLYIYSENDAIGRDRWHQKLTVDYKNAHFIVTALDYDSEDTLKPNTTLHCEVNFVGGVANKNKKPFKLEAKKIFLSDWGEKFIPTICKE